MATPMKTIKVAPDSELARVLHETTTLPVLLEKDGVYYRLDREEDPWRQHNPDRFEQVLREIAGSWADLDADALIADLYRAREEGTRSPDRP